MSNHVKLLPEELYSRIISHVHLLDLRWLKAINSGWRDAYRSKLRQLLQSQRRPSPLRLQTLSEYARSFPVHALAAKDYTSVPQGQRKPHAELVRLLTNNNPRQQTRGVNLGSGFVEARSIDPFGFLPIAYAMRNPTFALSDEASEQQVPCGARKSMEVLVLAVFLLADMPVRQKLGKYCNATCMHRDRGLMDMPHYAGSWCRVASQLTCQDAAFLIVAPLQSEHAGLNGHFAEGGIGGIGHFHPVGTHGINREWTIRLKEIAGLPLSEEELAAKEEFDAVTEDVSEESMEEEDY